MVAVKNQNGSGTPRSHTTPGKLEPSRMLLKLYSVSIIILDILTVLVKVLFTLLASLYEKLIYVHEKSIAGEIVLVTGTGHGIGKELAFQMAKLGATVVCWDINQEGNAETVKELSSMGYKVHPYKCDVSNREEVLEMAKKVKTDVGDVTVLVNNAGIMPCHPFMSHNEAEIRKIFDINVMAHFWMLEAFLPTMIANNHGHVVALSSMAGVMGIPNLVPYSSSKYAVRGLMDAMAEELREDARDIDVHFTTICPFIVDTGLCKKPRSRFPSLLGFVPPKKAASDIITAMRRNRHEVSIPGGLISLIYLLSLFPAKAARILKDFFDSGVESHD